MKLKKTLSIIGILAITGLIYGQANKTNSPEADKKKKIANSQERWHNPDYRPYIKSFHELIKLSQGFGDNKIRLSKSNYQTGVDIIRKMRERVQRFREESAEAKHLDEKWYWQTIDRKNKEDRIVAMMKQKAKMKSVTYFTRAIQHLDQVQRRGIRESEVFKTLLANIYRNWVKFQYDLGNLPQCIDLLERYMKIDPKYEEEVAPHKYIASAYGFQERLLRKTGGGSEDEIRFFKKKKNENLLRAAELMYGKSSPEYEQIMELVNRDEVIAVAP